MTSIVDFQMAAVIYNAILVIISVSRQERLYKTNSPQAVALKFNFWSF
jgi:hypothetical protein